ncbi:MAG TPA: sigma-70 family RNA polymerase sigma factor, partial [Vicinamibacterales bacterium]|nr:sigma-70 family RNA polymerase sigma factor [Vicinamibacterales bacterium]
ESSMRTFVFRIAHNRALAYLSRRRMTTVESHEDVRDRAPDPERTLSARQQSERLFEAIRLLPLAYAQVVTLTLEGLGYAEIAEVLGIRESNVGARRTRDAPGAVSFLLRRDAWAPASMTTTAFLDLSILRSRRRREGVVAQAVL